jgi:hypothetical protein
MASDQIPENRPENKEPAEGSRETVAASQDNAGASRNDTGDSRDNAGGITNRPLEEERQNQERVPPRGDSKEGGHA